jgi:hypothetical protein
MSVSSKLLASLRKNLILCLILMVSWIVRLVLVHNGGQLYWPDEGRYIRSEQFNFLWLRGDIIDSFRFLITTGV